MIVQLNGTLKVIFAEQVISDKLTKKEIVVTVDETTQYPQDIICQTVNDRTKLLDGFQMGQKVSVKCDLRGKQSKERYYNNFLVLEISKA